MTHVSCHPRIRMAFCGTHRRCPVALEGISQKFPLFGVSPSSNRSAKKAVSIVSPKGASQDLYNLYTSTSTHIHSLVFAWRDMSPERTSHVCDCPVLSCPRLARSHEDCPGHGQLRWGPERPHGEGCHRPLCQAGGVSAWREREARWCSERLRRVRFVDEFLKKDLSNTKYMLGTPETT